LSEYAVTPLYNIKAVVQATGISPSTLRAWERRYNIARPQRSDSGYRLYAERDVAVIRWLKAQVDAGMSISQAVSWLGTIVTDAGEMEQAILPTTGSGTPLHDSLATSLGNHREEVRGFNALQQDLIRALINYEEGEAELIVAEAFSMYSMEQVGEKLFMPVLMEMNERRERGELSITTEHFAGNYLIQRLGTLLRFIPNGTGSSLIWVGCARAELHEVGALLLGIYLRRSGYHIHYLGQNLPADEPTIKDFVSEAKRQQPAIILFSVSTTQAAEELSYLASHIAQIDDVPSIIGYSGPVFSRKPELRAAIGGAYMGASAKEVIQNIDTLLADKHRQEKKQNGKK
jgi:methanogenic corrinoid protein MtbC1